MLHSIARQKAVGGTELSQFNYIGRATRGSARDRVGPDGRFMTTSATVIFGAALEREINEQLSFGMELFGNTSKEPAAVLTTASAT